MSFKIGFHVNDLVTIHGFAAAAAVSTKTTAAYRQAGALTKAPLWHITLGGDSDGLSDSPYIYVCYKHRLPSTCNELKEKGGKKRRGEKKKGDSVG